MINLSVNLKEYCCNFKCTIGPCYEPTSNDPSTALIVVLVFVFMVVCILSAACKKRMGEQSSNNRPVIRSVQDFHRNGRISNQSSTSRSLNGQSNGRVPNQSSTRATAQTASNRLCRVNNQGLIPGASHGQFTNATNRVGDSFQIRQEFSAPYLIREELDSLPSYEEVVKQNV